MNPATDLRQRLWNPSAGKRWLGGGLLLAALIVGVQWTLGWAALLAPWRTLTLPGLTLVFLLTAGSYLIRAARVRSYYAERLQGRFPTVVRLSLIHNALNNFLPMRLGEAAYPLLLQRYFGAGLLAGTLSLAWIRLLDLHLLGLLALGFLYLRNGELLWAALAPPWLLAPALLLGFQARLQRLTAGRRGRIAQGLGELLRHRPEGQGRLLRLWGWTAASWGLKLLAYGTLVLHFAPMDPGTALLGVLGGELSSVLPVHGIAGAGTYEAAVAAVWLPLGVPGAQVVSAAVNLHLFLLGASGLLGLAALGLPRR